jgi:hypothetical protein
MACGNCAMRIVVDERGSSLNNDTTRSLNAIGY